jgi:hypothetical protein
MVVVVGGREDERRELGIEERGGREWVGSSIL